MKHLFDRQSTLQNYFRLSTTLAMLGLLLLSGHAFSQNQADYLSISTSKTDTTKTQANTIPVPIYDTIPRFYNHIWNIGFGLAFPLQDFHASDPQDTLSGYALQGVSLSTGLYLGFRDGGEAGWYFGAAYSGFNTAGFIDSLQAAAARLKPFPDSESGNVGIEEGYTPRYNIFTLNTGFAFEGSNKQVSAYGALLLNASFTNMNSVNLENPFLEENKLRIPFALSTGFSAKFGLRFQEQFNIGVAWHYLGRPEMGFNQTESPTGGVAQTNNPVDSFSNIPMARRIHFLEFHLGYAFIKRGGHRPPRVNITY